MIRNEEVAFVIEKYRNTFLELMQNIRNDLGKDLVTLHITKSEETILTENTFPELIDTDDELPIDIDLIQNLITAVYMTAFLVQEMSNSLPEGTVVDEMLATISDTGAEDGQRYAVFKQGSQH